MKTLLIAFALTFALAGCAGGPVNMLVDRDLGAAVKIADDSGDTNGAQCWRDLQKHNAQAVKGIFSMMEHAKTLPALDACWRTMMPLTPGYGTINPGPSPVFNLAK